MKNKKNLYIVWNPFQRRAQSLAHSFGMQTRYYYYPFEERGRLAKLVSYFFKSAAMLRDLIRNKPDFIFLQLAPTPLLYTAALYCAFTRCQYLSDCHNTMLYDDHWIHWPLAKYLLRKSALVVVHNTDVQAHSDALNIPSVILRDPLPVIEIPEGIRTVGGLDLENDIYTIIPCSMAPDEPLEELFQAIGSVPESKFVFTWFEDRVPAHLKDSAPDNVVFTGFLDEPEFNALYANANAAIVLTTREGTQPSGASEAISLGIPLVISSISTTRRLYGDKPVLVDNSVESIAAGVRDALSDYEGHSEKIRALKEGLVAEADEQTNQIKQSLGL